MGRAAGRRRPVWLTLSESKKIRINGTVVGGGTNAAPTLATEIPNQTAMSGTAFSYEVPAATFTDADGDTLTYTATLADGMALPAWLSFTAATRTFSGTPTAAETVSVKVTASDASDSVSDTFDIVVGLPLGTAMTLVSNFGGTSELSFPISRDRSQAFTTGAGATLSSVEIISRDSGGDDVAVSLCMVDGSDHPTSDCTPLTAPSSFAAGTLVFRAPANTTLAATTTYSLLMTSPGGEMLTLSTTSSDDEDAGGAMNWSIANVFDTETSTNVWAANSGRRALYITIKGTITASSNNAPTLATEIPNQTAMSGTVFSYQFPATTFNDADSDTLTYTATLADDMALPAWLSFTAATRAFSGTPQAADVETVSVKVTASDGNSGSVSDTFDIVVTRAANNAAMGEPTISGTARVGRTLTASTTGITDADGLTSPTYTYQWIRANGTDADIASANSSTYTLVGADLGKTIKVKVSFTDDASNTETLTSAAYPSSGTVQANNVLVSNVGQTQASIFSLATFDLAQSFRTGANATGYTLTSIELRLDSTNSTNTPAVKLYSGSANGMLEATFTGPAMLDASSVKNYAFTPSSAVILPRSTTYWVVAEGATDWTYTRSTGEDGTSAMGWSIGDDSKYRNADATGNFLTDPGNPFLIHVTGTLGGIVLSSDATLSALALEDASNNSAITISPPFASGTTSYTASVVNGVDEITIAPTVSESNATVEYLDSSDAAITDADSGKTGQQVSLSVDANTIKVKVTAEDTTTDTYTVVVTRAAAAPMVTDVDVTSAPDSGDTYGTSEMILFTVTFDQAVMVTGTPEFEFCLGTTATASCDMGPSPPARRRAALSSGSGTTALVFGYTVVVGDVDDHGIWIGDQDRTIKLETGDTIQGTVSGLDAVLTHDELGEKTGHKVNGASSNNAPTVATEIPDQTATSGTALDYTFPPDTFTDADGDTLTYTATLADDSALPPWLSFTAATRTFSGTPQAADVETVSVKVMASDGNGGSGSDTFDIVVDLPADTSPTLVSNAGQGDDHSSTNRIDRSQTFTTSVGATLSSVEIISEDLEGNDATVSLCTVDGSNHPTSDCTVLTAPPSFAAGTLVFRAPANTTLAANTTYSLLIASPGGEWLLLDATTSDNEDAGGATGWSIANTFDTETSSDTWVVSDWALRITIKGTINNAPTVATEIPDQTATTGTALDYTFPADTFTDADGDTLTYTATLADNSALPSWLSFSAATRTFSGTPTAAGTVSVKVTASDASDSVSDTFDIVVGLPGDTAMTLVSNATQGNDNSWNASQNRSQPFTTGAAGATLSSVEIISEDLEGDDVAVSLCMVDGSNHPTSDCTVLTAPSSFAAGTLVFTAPDGTTLAATTTYSLLVASLGGDLLKLDTTSSNNEDAGVATGWSIADTSASATSSTVWTSISTSLRITIKGTITASAVPAITIVAGTSPVTEGTPAVFTLSRTGSPIAALTVNVTVSETGGDMVAASNEGARTVTFLANSATATLSVATASDSVDEANSVVTATISADTGSPASYSVGTPASAMVTVEDNDIRDVTVSTTALTINEGATGTYTVVLDSQPTASVTVTPSRTGSSDVTFSPPTLTFTALNWNTVQPVTVTVAQDNDAVNDSATISHAVTGGDYAGVTVESVVVTVDDDETADTTAPRVASIVRETPTSSPTNADSLTWRVTFSEAVSNVDAADFAVSGTTATVTVAAVSGVTGAYDVTASGGDLASVNATVALTFSSSHGIEDGASNALSNTTPTGTNNNSYVLDNTAPSVTISGVPSASDAPFTATFTFSEAVTGFDVDDITLSNATASNFTATSTTVYTALVTPTAAGAVTVDVSANAAEDTLTNGNSAATRASSTFTLPVIAPTLVSNAGQGDTTSTGVTTDRAQAFTTSAGGTLSSVEIISADSEGDDATVSLCTTNSSGQPTSTCTALTAPSSFAAGTLVFTAPANTALTASTTYSLVITSPGGDSLFLSYTMSDNEDTGGATGWSIANVHDSRDNLNQWYIVGTALRITIKGTLNNAPTVATDDPGPDGDVGHGVQLPVSARHVH